jgi:MFS family permease
MNDNNRRILILSALTLAFWMPGYFYVQILPQYVQHLGGALAMVGVVGGAYGLTQALLRIPAGIGSDRLGRRKPFIAAGFVAGILTNLIFLTAASPWQLFWGQAMAGVLATNWVALTVFAAGWVAPDQVTRTMGYLFAINNIAQLIAGGSGALLTARWGWHAPFWAGLAVSSLGLILLKFTGQETTPAKERLTVGSLLAVARNRSVWLASLLGILVQYGPWALINFSPVVAGQLGASHAQLGWLSLFGAGATIVASYLAGTINRSMGRRRTLLVGMGVMIFGLAALPSVIAFWQLCLVMAAVGTGRGILLPSLMGYCQSEAPDSMRATAMGFFQALYAVGMFLGPTVTGLISDTFGLAAAFYLAAGILMIPVVWLSVKQNAV